MTFVTGGANAVDVSVTRSLETTSVGQTSIALVAVVVVGETFGVGMVVVADAEIDVIVETQQISILRAQRVILDDRRC